MVICAAVAAIWEVILSGSLGAMKSGTSPALVLKTLEAWEDPRHEILVYPEGPLMPCASVNIYIYVCVYCIINYIISYYIICLCVCRINHTYMCNIQVAGAGTNGGDACLFLCVCTGVGMIGPNSMNIQ